MIKGIQTNACHLEMAELKLLFLQSVVEQCNETVEQ